VKLEVNRSLPDADPRERTILFMMAAVILWMGIGSPFFTRRMETSTQNILRLMNRPQAYDALGGRNHDANGTDHSVLPVIGAGEARPAGAFVQVNSK
jgi:hypothetical protein